jgi:hypothetical protein
MERIIACARQRGFKRLEGVVLRANHGMLEFSKQLGFAIHEDAEEPEQVSVVLPLE